MTDSTGPAGTQGQSAANSASGDARVGAQFGFVTGDVHQYNIADSQQPRHKYDVAVRFLHAGAPARAAQLISEAVEAKFEGDDEVRRNHIAYHWMLAILSGRSFEQLGPDDFVAVKLAQNISDYRDCDEWLVGHKVMCKLLACLRRQDQSGRPDPGFSQVMQEYQELSAERRDDFDRHLYLLMEGGREDQQDARRAQDAILRRMSDGRTDRAWKSFEPTPEPPREHKPAEPDLLMTGRILAGTGAAAFLAAGAYCVQILWQDGVGRALLLGVVVLAGIVVTGMSAISHAALRERRAAKDREHGQDQLGRSRYSPPEPERAQPVTDDDPDEAETEEAERTRARRRKFVRVATDHLDQQFRKHAPRAATVRRRWFADTAGLRKSLRDEILAVYQESSLRLGSVNWLITYRVNNIARQWHDRSLREYRSQLQARPRTVLGLSVGIAGLAVAALYAVVTMIRLRPEAGAIATVAMIVAALLVAASRVDLYLVQRRTIRDGRPELTERFEGEQQEYQRWLEELRNRPGDEEIARWLDYDKIYLKTLAMNQLGLARRDILSSATLIEPGPGWIGVRVPFGPPRYSTYAVSVFLLTDAGVRQVAVTLDFLTGDAYDQVRRSFRHDAIASATVLETGIRFDTGRREAMPPEGQRGAGVHPSVAVLSDRAGGFDATLIVRQEILLRLMSSETIRFRVESFDADYHDPEMEDPTSLLNIALDTSGITAVLELLETISGHGAQWAAQRERQRRRWRESGPENYGEADPA